jgi:dienelactone hydrolase
MSRQICVLLVTLASFATTFPAMAQPARWRVEGELADYFAAEVAAIEGNSLVNIKTAEQWLGARPERSRQLFEMLGLQPQPARTPLKATTTGKLDGDGFRVENVHFQSRPGLYVTGNLYLPDGEQDKKEGATKYPAILYVCGHGGVKKDGISYGNKVHYQHHGAWFARNGYVCLTIDTLQLGEIEAIHHGTYSHDRWWWVSRGYTPAGVEAWNCSRALDFLTARPEVDAERLGVTGRSGGGAYSWWLTTTDPRIKVAVPVAGITDLNDHVVVGCVEGHCDCMYMLNTYRWNYDDVAALVAPRPLLISNTDRDGIFPLPGVVATYSRTAKIYDLLGKRDDIALQITAGPHKDTQELRIHAFRWFNHHLRGTDELIDKPAIKYFEPEQLRVFSDKLPADEINTKIDEVFVAKADSLAQTPRQAGGLAEFSSNRLKDLRRLSFRGWPSDETQPISKLLGSEKSDEIELTAHRLVTQPHVSTGLLTLKRGDVKRIKMIIADQESWETTWHPVWNFSDSAQTVEEPPRELIANSVDPDSMTVIVAPRGIGPHAWTVDERKANQIRRRFYLLGQTVDGMRTWDIRQAIRWARRQDPDLPLEIEATGKVAGLALYASLFEDAPDKMTLTDLPETHRVGPTYLNVLRFMDIPQAALIAASRADTRLVVQKTPAWEQLSHWAEGNDMLDIRFKK